jgi:hypothetical protein
MSCLFPFRSAIHSFDWLEGPETRALLFQEYIICPIHPYRVTLQSLLHTDHQRISKDRLGQSRCIEAASEMDGYGAPTLRSGPRISDPS